jgi:spore coat protein U-like protein
MKIKVLSSLLLAALLLPQASFAQTASTTLTNTTDIQSLCQVSVSPMNFGTFNPLSTTLVQASATVSLRCTPGSISMSLSGGQNATVYKFTGDQYDRTLCQRAMKNTSSNHYVAYDLYYIESSYKPDNSHGANPQPQTSTCNEAFGTSIGGTPFNVANQGYNTITIRGAIRNNPLDAQVRNAFVNPKNAKAGVYLDTVTLKITY